MARWLSASAPALNSRHPVSGCKHLPRVKTPGRAAAMGKRKVKDEEPELIDAGVSGRDSEHQAPQAKQRRTPTKKGDAKASPARKREPARPKVTETQTGADGWTLHPPSLIYKYGGHARAMAHACMYACRMLGGLSQAMTCLSFRAAGSQTTNPTRRSQRSIS